MTTASVSTVFEEARPHLMGVAYRMLGALSEAEDAVQETFLRWHRADRDEISNPKGWLTTVLCRLCIDELRSARVRRDAYTGPWLPEPVATDADDAFDLLEKADTISMAFMLILERLAPEERAAFLLRDAFDYDYSEIGSILRKSEPACRQLVSRARARLRQERPRFSARQEDHDRLLASFEKAAVTLDLTDLLQVFADDIELWTDGGGRALAARNVIYGKEKVARFFVGISKKMPPGLRGERRLINGFPGYVMWMEDEIYMTMSLDVADGKVTSIQMMRNPDKLTRIPQ